jgi:hypothetical protein
MKRSFKIAIVAGILIAAFSVIMIPGFLFALFYTFYVLILGLGIPILILAGIGFGIYLLIKRWKAKK